MPTTIAVKSDPKLWAGIKKKWMNSTPDKTWNARKAMLAVQEYKRRGGTYIGKKQKNNSLKKWEREDWNYIDGNKNSRYLPKKVRDKLTSKEKITETKLKMGKKGKKIPYSKSVLVKFRKIVSPKKSAKKSTKHKKLLYCL
jgi:hypothetical protein